jgi:hypothetical protein
MSGFVVYKDHDGWFRWATAERWDRPGNQFEGQRLDTRIEIARCDTKDEARDVRHAYNMMCNGKPTDNHTYNQMLERKAND